MKRVCLIIIPVGADLGVCLMTRTTAVGRPYKAICAVKRENCRRRACPCPARTHHAAPHRK